MIWIATIGLLVLAAWLFFNALNERRWVQEHLDDQNVLADKGLVPAYTRLSRSAAPEERYSINQADDSVSRLATRVKEKTANLSAVIEQKAAGLVSDKATASLEGRSYSAIGNAVTGSDSIIGRAAEKLSKASEKIPFDKIKPDRLKKKSSEQATTGQIRNSIKNLSDRLDQIQSKVDA